MSKRSRKLTPFERVMQNWGTRALPRFAVLDETIRGRRGPRGTATTAALMCGTAALMRQGRRYFISDVCDFLADELSPAQRRMLGLRKAPSESSLRRLEGRLDRSCRTAEGEPLPSRCQDLLDRIVEGSAPTPSADWDGTMATDATLFNAWCRPVTRRQWDGGVRGADPDAGPRIIDRPSGPEHYFGYAAITQERATPGHPEYIDAVAIIPAHHYDVEAAFDLSNRLASRAFPKKHELIDKGFSANGDYLELLRSLGVSAHFDLKVNQGGPEGPHESGCPIVDGWVYAESLPQAHRRRRVLRDGKWKLEPWRKPGPRASKADRDSWTKHKEVLARHAFRVHGRPEPHRVRAQHPFGRKQLVCKDRPESWAWHRDGMPICNGGHKPGEGCFTNTIWISAKDSPHTFQVPHYGSDERDVLYGARSSVERGNSALKDEAKVHFKPGMFRVRGIVRVGIFLALAVVTHNLLLADPPRRRESRRTSSD